MLLHAAQLLTSLKASSRRIPLICLTETIYLEINVIYPRYARVWRMDAEWNLRVEYLAQRTSVKQINESAA